VMPDSSPYKLRVPLESAFDATIGFVVDEPSDIDRCTGHLPVRPQVCQPLGMIHGGVYAAIAETLASTGTARGVFAAGGAALGMSNNTSFLRPITEGSVHGTAVAGVAQPGCGMSKCVMIRIDSVRRRGSRLQYGHEPICADLNSRRPPVRGR
jgi:uncharacterized protein (TIGR00369 family)